MELAPNYDIEILTKCGWKPKNLEYFGVLVYNITTNNEEPIADIICKRDVNGIEVDWFIPNKEGEKISLVYDSKTNSIIFEKSDKEIKNYTDLSAFLDTIENTIKNQNSDFLSKSKIQKITKNNFTV